MPYSPLTIPYTEIDSGVSGPALLVTGAIHGYETCGTVAIQKWIKAFESGAVTLKKGAVRFVPICNPKAQDEMVRFIDINLNRIIKMHDEPRLYEEFCANEIYPHLEWATHVVDLHSYVADDVPFVFCEKDTRAMLDFVSLSAVPYVMLGFDDLLRERDLLDNYHAVENTAIHMNKLACTVECGQNESPHAPRVADESIGNFLSGLGMIDNSAKSGRKHYYEAFDIVYKARAGHHVKAWRNFEKVKKGDIIARYEDGEEVRASGDGVIFLPRDKEVGSEWFHLAKKLSDVTF